VGGLNSFRNVLAPAGLQATRGGRIEAPDATAAADTIPEAALRRRFDAIRTERVVERQFHARKGL